MNTRLDESENDILDTGGGNVHSCKLDRRNLMMKNEGQKRLELMGGEVRLE